MTNMLKYVLTKDDLRHQRTMTNVLKYVLTKDDLRYQRTMTHVLKYVLTKDDRRYQRTVTHVRGLTARPVWPMEELPKKYQDKLLEIQSNWEKVRYTSTCQLSTISPCRPSHP